MAEGIGVDGIHCVSGTCDLCGDACDVNTQELNVLSCTFAKCEDLCYHQDCLEKYLKSIRLERNRKTGFKCPRGCGKGSAHKDSCPGKIDKSHPIHPRNEEQKKKKKAKAPDVAPLVNNRPKTKEERKAEKATVVAAAKDKAAAVVVDNRRNGARPNAGNTKCATATAATSAAAAAKVAPPAAARPPPPPETRRQQLTEAVAALRRELASGKPSREPTPPQTATAAAAVAAAAAPVEYKTLDMYYRENAASTSNSNLTNLTSSTAATASVANAWAKPPPVPATAAGRHKQVAAAAPSAADSSRGHMPHSLSTPGGLHTAGHGNAHSQMVMSRLESHAAAATQLPPPPPPPPPPDQHHGLASVLRTSSSSSIPTPTGSSNISNAAAAFHAAANGHVPVGMEYLSEEEQQHLSKAQRKNLKRAEKKKRKEDACFAAAADAELAATAAAAAPGRPSSGGGASSSSNAGASSSNWASPGTAAPASGSAGAAAGRASPAAAEEEEEDSESLGLMYELAVQALLAHKTLALVASLQRLGFTEWQAAAAVQRFGSDVEDAVAWLLDGGAPSAAAAAAVSQGCVAQVDITEDLSLLEQLLSALVQIPRSKLYQAVADTGGDLDAATAVCLQQTEVAEETAAVQDEEQEDSSSAAEQSSTGALPSGTGAASFQRAASSDHNAIDSSNLFDVQPGLYTMAGIGAAADATYTGWLNGSSSSGIGFNGPVSHHSNASGSLSAAAAPSAALRTGSSNLGFLAPSSSTAAAAAGLGSSIWTTEAPAAASSIWGQGRTSSSLFGAGSSGNMSLLGPSTSLDHGTELNGGSSSVLSGSGLPNLGLGLGSGLNPQQLLNPQQSLSAADPVLETFSSGSLFSNNNLGQDSTSDPPAAAAAAGNSAAGALASSVNPALQGSRLFQSYGWGQQQSLFGQGAQQQQQQVVLGDATAAAATAAGGGGGGQQHHDVDETDLEGLMATLMCH